MKAYEIYASRLDEQYWLDYFWTMTRTDVERIDLLVQLAHVSVPRPSEWDEAFVRQGMAGMRMTLVSDDCFVCRQRSFRLYWHHIVMVSHGGSSTPRNLVSLCHACHRKVHPWLPAPTSLENRRGWTWIGDLVSPVFEKVLAMVGGRHAVSKRKPSWRQ